MARPLVDINDVVVSQLAREIAREIVPTNVILKKFRLDTQTYEHIFDMPFFQRRLEEELALWNGSEASSIRTRIAAKAATIIEESLVECFDLIHDKAQPMSGKVEMLKHIARLANMESGTSANVDSDSKVVINISFGKETVRFEKERVIDVVPTEV